MLPSPFHTDNRVILQTDQCVISADEIKSPQPGDASGNARKMRVNIKMVIKCPSASYDVEPGAIAPPSSPTEMFQPVKTTKEHVSPTAKVNDDYPTTENCIGRKAGTAATTRSAPARIRTPFGKRNETVAKTRVTKPPNYVWGFNHESRFAPKTKVVLRPFSERLKSSDNYYCFTCKRRSGNQHLQATGAELGSFRGKTPLTPFTRLGCYRSSLKTTQLKLNRCSETGRIVATRQTLSSADSCLHDDDHVAKSVPQKQEAMLADERAKEKVAAHTATDQGKRKGSSSSTSNDKTSLNGSHFFTKRRGLVQEWITQSHVPSSQPVLNNAPVKTRYDSSRESEAVVAKSTVSSSPFRRTLKNDLIIAKWRTETNNKSSHSPNWQKNRLVDVRKNRLHERFLPRRITLNPFSPQRVY